jgi:hypothetical protein
MGIVARREVRREDIGLDSGAFSHATRVGEREIDAAHDERRDEDYACYDSQYYVGEVVVPAFTPAHSVSLDGRLYKHFVELESYALLSSRALCRRKIFKSPLS